MVVNTLDYWIYENKLIFKPRFNEKLNWYMDIIRESDELVFSNYSNVDALIVTDNIYKCKYRHYYSKSLFDQPIDLSSNVNLTRITFGVCFDNSVNLSSNLNLTHLTFGDVFNQPVDFSSNTKLTHITFGWYFNQPVNFSSNPNLTQITFGMCFNQPIDLSSIVELIQISFGIKCSFLR